MWSCLTSTERLLDCLLGKNIDGLVLCVCWASLVEIFFEECPQLCGYLRLFDMSKLLWLHEP